MTRHSALLAAGLFMAAPALQAQQPAPQPQRIGHIVAVVGDSVIFNFDLEQALFSRAAEMRQELPPPGPERDAIVEDVLRDRINELLIIQAALRDTTIQIPEDQIARAVQQDIEQRQQAAGGPAAFEQALRASGLTPAEYRDLLTQQQRSATLFQTYLQRTRQQRKPPPVTDAEMRRLFDENREFFGQRPATVDFEQVTVRTLPSLDALSVARAKADSVMARVLAREDFAQLARRYTEDGTRDVGGDLGWFRRGSMVRDFEDVAFNMRAGEVRGPVLTEHGWHIIKVERVRGSEIQARHIVFRPERTVEDARRARARADTVAERLRAGAEATALAREYGDPNQQVRQNHADVQRVRQALGVDLSAASPGEVVGPIPVGGAEVADEFIVLRVVSRQDARPWSLDDPEAREEVRSRIEIQKLIEEVITELRRDTYVEIRR